MDSQKPLFSVFIPTWNNLEFLKLCVESIEKNSAYPHEILIHVNDGSDGTLEWVRAKGFKHTHSTENIGVCWAMNRLRTLMTTDYVMYINDDMYMLPGWDSELYAEVGKMDHKLWYLGSTMIQPRAHFRYVNSIKVADFGRTPATFNEQALLESYASLAPADWQGAVLPPTLVHRNTWDLVGGYSIEYTPGMASDPDFNAKLWMAGVRTFKGLGKSLCYHFMSVSVNRIRKNEGPIQFLRKWGLTVRAFQKEILHTDAPWDSPRGINRKSLATELTRSRAKALLTALRSTHAPTLWSNPND
ncbi:MAG: glycosyltransferase [Firmicutes bacterium]|nr:glycosyltransferase [Bacillota bacterium]MCM1400974.1 glycosyltransferase [Bacteroides sp.]MCM1476497.1 glycosyltransferase [Bacteroides sp.]